MCIEFVVKTCPENDGWEVNLVGKYLGLVVCGLSSKQASLSGFVSMLAWISAHFEKVSAVCIIFRVILDFEYFFHLKTYSDQVLSLLRCISETKLNNSGFIINKCFKRQIPTEWIFSVIFQKLFIVEGNMWLREGALNISKCEFNGNDWKLKNMSTSLK